MIIDIISDEVFWIAVIFIAAGFVLFKMINKSFANQRKRLEDPRENFEKFIAEKFGNDWPQRPYTFIARFIPLFMMSLGSVILIMMILKY